MQRYPAFMKSTNFQQTAGAACPTLTPPITRQDLDTVKLGFGREPLKFGDGGLQDTGDFVGIMPVSFYSLLGKAALCLDLSRISSMNDDLMERRGQKHDKKQTTIDGRGPGC